jgi:UDP-glucose 4-epimerase
VKRGSLYAANWPTIRKWRGTRVLVTGASGFIGTHLVSRLAELGAEVHSVSRVRTGPGWHRADLRTAEGTAKVVAEVLPDVVFHLAGEVTGARDPQVVLPVLEGNLVSTVNLLAALTSRPEARVVIAGSMEEPRPDEPVPSSPYAVAKWAAEGYARLFHHLWRTHVCHLRIAMVYGPGTQDTNRLLPYVTRALLRGERPLLTNGSRELDWIYVDDVVEAFLAAAASDQTARQTFDIGSGTGTSIKDTVEMVERLLDRPGGARFGALPDRPLDSARIADPGPARELLGWRPATDLADGLRRTVGWFAGQLRA